MPIIPTVRCSSMKASLAFYCQVLDFVQVDKPDWLEDPSFCTLQRDDGWIHLSSFGGDGTFGQAVAIVVEDIDALFQKFLDRGLRIPERDSPVHRGPLEQSWGTREFYVDDPDRNTLRFIQFANTASSA
ncbi:VOC family protein [Solilutibacter silvestris]|uniref:VOC family protein n=1 Tax=Solilutibacter silvestris TaxID=1645665 RepID=UPI003D330A55